MPYCLAYFRTQSFRYTAGRVTHRTTVAFSPQRWNIRTHGLEPCDDLSLDDSLKKLGELGMKFGFRIKRSQRVQQLIVHGPGGDVDVPEAKKVTQELERSFKPEAGEKWVGFEAPPVPPDAQYLRDGLVAAHYTISLQGVKSLPQLIPVVYAYGKQRFSQHHLLGVVVLSKDMERLETIVQCLPPRRAAT